MTYHSEFWIAVATVSPVLALGHVVAIGRGPSAFNAAALPVVRRHTLLAVAADAAAKEVVEAERALKAGRDEADFEATLERLALADLRATGLANEAIRLSGEVARRSRAVSVLDFLTLWSWLLCVGALAQSLLSLAWSRDVWPSPAVTVCFLVAVGAFLFAPTMSEALTSHFDDGGAVGPRSE